MLYHNLDVYVKIQNDKKCKSYSSRQYGTEGFNGDPQLEPHDAERCEPLE